MNDHYLLDHANDTIARRHAEADRGRLGRTGRSGRRRRASRRPQGLTLGRVPLS